MASYILYVHTIWICTWVRLWRNSEFIFLCHFQHLQISVHFFKIKTINMCSYWTVVILPGGYSTKLATCILGWGDSNDSFRYDGLHNEAFGIKRLSSKLSYIIRIRWSVKRFLKLLLEFRFCSSRIKKSPDNSRECFRGYSRCSICHFKQRGFAAYLNIHEGRESSSEWSSLRSEHSW